MMDWFERLSSKEQYYVLTGGVVLTITLVFLLLIEPMQIRNEKSLNQLTSAKNLYHFMQDVADKAERLRVFEAGQKKYQAKTNLFSKVEQGLKLAGISGDLTSITPSSDNGVSLRFDDVNFDKFIRWLLQTHNQYGLLVESFNVTNTTKEGRVRVSIDIR